MMRRSWLVLAAVLMIGIPAPSPAQERTPTAAELERSAGEDVRPAGSQDGFRAAQAQQAADRTMRGYWHLFIAFAVTWLLLFGYTLTLGRRFGRLERELERVGG